MPVLGIGLHMIVAIFFAIDAMRRGRPMYWMVILFTFPLLGSLVYFVVEYLPGSKMQRSLNKGLNQVAKSLDPGRELREATDAFDLAPTAQNQMRIAAAFLNAGDPTQAATHYEAALCGPFASDPTMRLGAATARVQLGQFAQAATLLRQIRADSPAFAAEACSIQLALALAGSGDEAGARATFEQAATQFGTVAVQGEYAIWALGRGDNATADRLQTEIDRATKHWSAHNRELNADVLKRLKGARAAG